MNEAANLHALFENVNRAEFARKHGVPGGESMIYQHISGRKPISLACAVAYAIGFGKPLAEISPRLADLIDRLPKPPPAAHAGTLSAKVVPLPTESPLKAELAAVVDKISDRGLILLIEQAEQLAGRFPKAKANHAS